MRRLFSTFARGAPGAGLLLLRVVGGVCAITQAVVDLSTGLSIGSIPAALALFAGALLLLGLWTPATGTVLAALEVRAMILAHPAAFTDVVTGPELQLGTIGAALALLGPGAWSIDAWLFGWRRIDVRERTS